MKHVYGFYFLRFRIGGTNSSWYLVDLPGLLVECFHIEYSTVSIVTWSYKLIVRELSNLQHCLSMVYFSFVHDFFVFHNYHFSLSINKIQRVLTIIWNYLKSAEFFLWDPHLFEWFLLTNVPNSVNSRILVERVESSVNWRRVHRSRGSSCLWLENLDTLTCAVTKHNL